MSQKRKAAANVFMEQNAAQQSDEVDMLREVAELASGGALPPGAPAQQMAMAYAPSPAPASRARGVSRSPVPQDGLKTSEELQLEKEPIRVRETGFWFWRRIIVPPNAYVVHTRIGRKEPVTLGLGLSFRYNPYTDAYMVVPAAMQTIGIVAYAISKEKQGINILAYVQWQIDNFGVAYRKLDFSDTRDPLGIVNAQLREQAEAAIKDKIATMSVEDVLTDKEPIIEELTTRLKAVSEGRGLSGQATDEGLGIKIVTVQMKEALVSSQRLWEHLQAPFRYEQEKTARISFLLTQDEIRKKELETRQISETSEAETLVAIERIKQGKQTEALQLRLDEEGTRFTREQEAARQKLQLEEQTTLARRESEQRVQEQAARVQQELQLAQLNREQEAARQKVQLEEQTTLTRRESEQRVQEQAARVQQEARLTQLRRQQEQAIEQTRLDADASARQKTLQVEQALQEITEQTRLEETQTQATQQQIERETTINTLRAELRLLEQRQEAQIQAQTLETQLERIRRETLLKLELEEAQNRVTISLAEQEAAVTRLHQEIRNLISQDDLSSRLIEQLPQLAASMPEIHELKVLQTGQGDGAFDALPTFLAKLLAVAESMGLRVGNGSRSAESN